MKLITQKGIWVSSSFTKTFGNKEVKPSKTVPSFKTLERPMNDSEIKKELGVEECTLSDIAAFLKSPPKGTDDGYWNLFYVAGFVVSVDWRADHQEWRMGAWKLGVFAWDAGRRAFSRNWHSEPKHSSPNLGSLEERVAKLEKWFKDHNFEI